MTDIFNRNIGTIGDAFSADSLVFNFNTGEGEGEQIGLIVQNISVQYTQPVNKMYDLADNQHAYYVAGRPQGVCQMAKILGKSAAVQKFYTQFGDVCNAKDTNISFTNSYGCDSEGGGGVSGASFKIISPVISTFGMSVSVDDAIITENTALTFHSLEII